MTDTLIVMCARSPPCPLVLLRGRERRACVADWSVGHSWSYVGLCHCARCPGRPCKAEPVRGVGGEEAEPRRAAFLPHPATRKSGRRGRGAKPKQIFDLHSGITRDRFVSGTSRRYRVVTRPTRRLARQLDARGRGTVVRVFPRFRLPVGRWVAPPSWFGGWVDASRGPPSAFVRGPRSGTPGSPKPAGGRTALIERHKEARFATGSGIYLEIRHT
jgi:hypothetical protein